jgi:hypothetical protein
MRYLFISKLCMMGIPQLLNNAAVQDLTPPSVLLAPSGLVIGIKPVKPGTYW